MTGWVGKGMSEAAVARSSIQSGRSDPRRIRLNPLEALERGFALFQSTFAREAWRYYAGSAPLVLAFIPMWVADGQIRILGGILLIQSALLAGAYLLRIWMVAGYMRRVRERAFGVALSKTANAATLPAAMGRLLAWKIALGLATLATLPTVAAASWFYSASEFASLEAREDTTERHSFSGCLALASQWFGGGLLFFVMLFPLWAAVWLNGFLLALILPQLLHSIFGMNTVLSTQMGVRSLFQSSAFWLSLFAGAWLALDPVVKCTFIVVHQHLRSRREGDDLRGLLADLPRRQEQKAELITSAATGRRLRIGALVLLAAIAVGVSQPAGARMVQASPNQSRVEAAADLGQPVRVQKLRQALQEESQRQIYQWHDPEHPNPPTWLDNLLARIEQAIDRAWNAFLNFLRNLWPRGLTFSGNEKRDGWRMKDLRLWVALVVALTFLVGAALFWLRRHREAAQVSLPVAAAPLPDLSDVAVAAERSEDEWFALASRLEAEGELRLALRAAYLGLLAGLAQREWLTIRRDRTNREYLDEFTRRWRRRPRAAVEVRAEVPEKLRGSLRLFDRVWYGSYVLTPATVAAYRQTQRELLSHV